MEQPAKAQPLWRPAAYTGGRASLVFWWSQMPVAVSFIHISLSSPLIPAHGNIRGDKCPKKIRPRGLRVNNHLNAPVPESLPLPTSHLTMSHKIFINLISKRSQLVAGSSH